MGTITVVVLRPLLLKGERQEPHTRLDLTPLDAADLVASGRAVLLHPRDASLMKEAVASATGKAMRQAGHIGPRVTSSVA